MLTPSADAFAALARSSPWRWSTLRFTARWHWEGAWQPVRAWLRRPDALRVEEGGDRPPRIVREQPQQVGVLAPTGGYRATLPWPRSGPAPRLRPDGLVAERPDDLSYDDPMYESYFWVAMLDPAELADGRDPESGLPAGPPLHVDSVAEVEHGGRPAWEAMVRTTPFYEPRCGCCPLLRSRDVDVREWGHALLAEYPTAHRVRLDVGTGVCVLTEQIGGSAAGQGHDLRIEAVDEPMGDDLFTAPRRPQ